MGREASVAAGRVSDLSELKAVLNTAESSARVFAVIPAAGRSRRMGSPKLQLPFGEATLIERVLQAWTESRVSQSVVVVRSDDLSLQSVCRHWPVATVVAENDPADMRQSVQIGLRYLESNWNPTHSDRCFFAPADLPALSSGLIDSLISIQAAPDHIVVPSFGGRTGHPILFPWNLTRDIFELSADEGIRHLLQRHPRTTLDLPANERIGDVDTPEDYKSALRRMSDSGDQT